MATLSETVQLFKSMNMIEVLAFLNIAPEEVTTDTYVYVTDGGEICAIEKWNRSSYPADEFDCGEYVVASGRLGDVRTSLREFLSVH